MIVADARACELLISVQIKLFRRLSDLLHPRLKLFHGNRNRLEMHVSLTATAYLLILTVIMPRSISREVAIGFHASMALNLAAKLREKKEVITVSEVSLKLTRTSTGKLI